jgi:hypothetical protein
MDTALDLPPIVYAPDAPLSELRTAELLLVTTLRLFALPWRAPGRPCPDWRGGLLAADLDAGAITAFDTLFSIVTAGPRRPLDVRCPCRRMLGIDEGRLLQLVSLFQHGRWSLGEAILGDWLLPAPRRLAMSPAQGLAASLARGHLILPWRHPEEPTLHRVPPAHANRGLALLQ